MSEWKEVELKYVADYRKDKIDASLLTRSNYISTENMLPEKQGITYSSYVPTEGKYSKYSAQNVLVSNIRPYFKKIWFATKDGGCSNDVIVFEANNAIIYPKFLYYQLSKDDFFDFVMSGSNGTKMPRGNRNSIPSFKILLPPIATQKRIAYILSAYDDHIENNLKRIKLLEELAQRTYDEWFVKFRVNGKQLDVGENGLPEGWERKKIGNTAIIIGDGNYSAKYPKVDDFIQQGIPFFSTREINNGRLSVAGVKRISNSQHLTLKKGHLHTGDVLLTTRGSIGKVAYVDEDFEGYNISAQLVLFRCDNDSIFNSFLYYQLSSTSVINQLIGVGTGTAQPQLPIKTLKHFEILCPPRDTQAQFHNLINSNIHLVSLLMRKNIFLKESRDILLPRLMSGEIDVEREVLGMVAEENSQYQNL